MPPTLHPVLAGAIEQGSVSVEHAQMLAGHPLMVQMIARGEVKLREALKLDEDQVGLLVDKAMGKYLPLFKQAPQFVHFTEERMERFVAAVLEFEPERLSSFYIPRLRGLGGSEIGAVIGPEFGEYNPFKSQRHVVREKLLLAMPEPPNGHCMRGMMMEPRIREIFRNATQCRPLEKELVQLARFTSKRTPWMVGMPDELVVMNGRVYLIDYKSPSDPDAYRAGAPFDYVAQLHQYLMVTREMGIHVDELLLCAISPTQEVWEPQLLSIEINEQMVEAIEDIGSDIWNNYVMSSTMPPFKARREEPLELGFMPDAQEITQKIEDLTVLRLVAAEAKRRDDALKAEIEAKLLKMDVKGAAKHGGVEVTVASKVNQKAMLDCLEAHGIPVDQVQPEVPDVKVMMKLLTEAGIPKESWTKRGDISSDLVIAELEKLEEDPRQFEEKAFSVALARGKSGPAFEALAAAKKEAAQIVDTLLVTHKQKQAEELASIGLMQTPVAEVAPQPVPAEEPAPEVDATPPVQRRPARRF